MSPAGEVVIRSDDGKTEFVFPPGFDPIKAAAIVKGAQQQLTQTEPLAAHAGPRAPGGYETSDYQPEHPLTPLVELLKPLAHPKELSDFVQLLIPNLGGISQEALNFYTSTGRKAAASSKTLRQFSTEWIAEMYRRAVGNPRMEAALAKLNKSGAPKLNDVLSSVLEETKNVDTVNMPQEIAGSRKAIAKVATKGKASMEPQLRPGRAQATVPDKWGVTSITFPDEVQLMKDAVTKGQSASSIARTLSNGNTSKFSALMKAYMQKAAP